MLFIYHFNIIFWRQSFFLKQLYHVLSPNSITLPCKGTVCLFQKTNYSFRPIILLFSTQITNVFLKRSCIILYFFSCRNKTVYIFASLYNPKLSYFLCTHSLLPTAFFTSLGGILFPPLINLVFRTYTDRYSLSLPIKHLQLF